MSIAQNFPALKPSLLLDFASTKQLDNRITFTRSTPAVYYDGKTTAMAEQNLFTYSQAISNWARFGSATATDNYAVAPDGTTTATRFQASSDGSGVYQFINTPDSTVLTSTVYMKSNTGSSQTITLYGNGGGAQTQMTVTTSWQRFTFTFTQNTTKSTGIYRNTGDNATDILMWGGQIEARSTATAYTATTTQPITNYIPVLLTAGGNQARFDCNPTTGESLGLLIEEARTNFVTYSQDFSNAIWNKVRTTLYVNTVVAPDGTLTGDFFTTNGTAGTKIVYELSVTTPAANSIYTGSVFVKNNGSSGLFKIEMGSGSNNGQGTFNLSTGVVGTFTISGTVTASSGTITSVGNGWYKCTLTITHGPSWSGATNIAFYDESSQTASTVTGMSIWGAQVEAGSFATSYIATTSASATRTADNASMTGANFTSWFNNAQGTTYVETSCIGSSSSGYFGVCKFNDGSIANRFGIYGRPSGAGYGAVMTTNGTTVAGLEPISGSTATIVNTYSKITYSYQVNNFSATRNASTVTTDTAGDVAVVNRFDIGLYDDVLNGYIKKLAYYPIAVTSANLQALTS